MKTIKINFVGFWDGFIPETSLIMKILKKHYNVEVTDDADYLFCSMFNSGYDYCKFPQTRIFYCGENFAPDFNLVDYAISSCPINYLDRHYYFPEFAFSWEKCKELLNRNNIFTLTDLKQKTYFANFIAGHESENSKRGDFFKKLCNYKRVESAGSYLNNLPNNESVNFLDGSKFIFQKKCKFTLCFESTKFEGFITEKILDAFCANTIPIYYGSDNVTDFFNKKAFINISDFDSEEEAIEFIKELDTNDEKYLDMLNQPVFNSKENINRIYDGLEEFLCNILEFSLDTVKRRSQVYYPKKLEKTIINRIIEKRNVFSPKTKDSFYSQVIKKLKRLVKIILGKPVCREKYRFNFLDFIDKTNQNYALLNYNKNDNYRLLELGAKLEILAENKELMLKETFSLLESLYKNKKYFKVIKNKNNVELFYDYHKIVELSFLSIKEKFIKSDVGCNIFANLVIKEGVKVLSLKCQLILDLIDIVRERGCRERYLYLKENKEKIDYNILSSIFSENIPLKNSIDTILESFN